MAEIHVHPKKQNASPAWIWILVVLALVVAVAYFLMRGNTTNETEMQRDPVARTVISQPVFITDHF
jgi:flagellar basal body-associated protein FliL